LKILEPEEVPVGPEEVLELMRSAPERYETVRAALRYRGDGATIKALRDKYLASETRRLETGGAPGSSGEDMHSEPDGPFGWRCRVWYAGVSPERSERYRVELELPKEVYPGGGVDISAWDGRIVGSRGTDTVVNSRTGGSSREDDPLWLVLAQDSFWTTYFFDPDGIAGLPLYRLDLSVEGKTRKAGREAIRLVGVPVEEWEYFPEPLWWGADEYEVVVDAERGVLLRCASRLNGEDFDALEVEEIYFDERFGEDVFTSREPLPWRL
jgi:hypothetical protein